MLYEVDPADEVCPRDQLDYIAGSESLDPSGSCWIHVLVVPASIVFSEVASSHKIRLDFLPVYVVAARNSKHTGFRPGEGAKIWVVMPLF